MTTSMWPEEAVQAAATAMHPDCDRSACPAHEVWVHQAREALKAAEPYARAAVDALMHAQTCLDCSIQHAKCKVRREQGKSVPLVYDVEPFIPDDLKRAFWQRYVGKYFDGVLESQ